MVSKPKIVFLFTPGPIGGAEKVVVNGIKALLDAGHLVELWVINEERVPQITEAFTKLLSGQNISARTFNSRNVLDVRLIQDLKKSLSEDRPDVIHAHGFKAAFYAKLIHKNIKLIVTHHGKTGHTLKVKLYEFLELLVMKYSDSVIAVSTDMKNQLIERGIKPKKIKIIENFLTTSVPQITQRKNPITKFLYVGRLSPEKGCVLILDAISALKDENVYLTILGDGTERSSIESRILELALQEKVKLVGFQKDVTPFMATCDAIIMPSYREGQPLTLIEACCLGIPVVASNVGGIPELVKTGENGYLFTPGDSNEMAQKILEFINNKERIANNAQILKFKYRERFSSHTWANNTSNLYQNVLNQS